MPTDDSAATPEPGSAVARYRIKDLVERTGVSKETIHFYLTEGLLPKARKTARNMAWYGDEHVERLKAIKELQEKQFLPLKAIKAVLGDVREAEFTAEQQRTIAALQSRLVPRDPSSPPRFVSFSELQARYRVRPFEIDELEAAGVVTVERSGRVRRVDAEDEGVVRLWAELRDIGFGPARGFGPRDAVLMENLVSILFGEELRLLMSRGAGLEPEDAARMVEQAVPRINELLGVLHVRRVRRFLREFESKPKKERK